MARKLFWAIWKRWVATDIHLDQSSLLRKQCLHCVEFSGERENHLLNLHLGELLVLLETSRCLVCGNLSRTCCGWGCSTSRDTWEDDVQKESLHFAAALSTCFCWIEGVVAEAVVAAVSFCSPFEQIVEKMNFLVWDTTLQHCLGGAVVRTPSGIL